MTGNLERLLIVEKEKERLQTELEIAREVQSQLYPKEAPPIHGLQLTVRCDPARMVSGYYYDYQEVGDNKLSFAIGDVAGKGIYGPANGYYSGGAACAACAISGISR